MELSIKPHNKNLHPRRALLVRSSSPVAWLEEIRLAGLSLKEVTVIPVPGVRANEVYGCIVLLSVGQKILRNGRSSLCQLVNNKLFIPENTDVYPSISSGEWDRLLPGRHYCFFPETGLAELPEPVEWATLIVPPLVRQVKVTVPLKGVYIPQKINSLSIEADPKELAASVEDSLGADASGEKLPFNLEKLMKGNKKEVAKYLKFLEKNPELALKYALPLDLLNSSRGGATGSWRFGGNASGDGGAAVAAVVLVIIVMVFAIIMYNHVTDGESKPTIFPVFIAIFVGRYIYNLLKGGGSLSGGGGGAALLDTDTFSTLRNKYEELADKYIKNKQYKQAAAIHMKLLKNPYRAGKILEEGSCYGEAGSIFLKHCKDKTSAAQCYEKGKLYLPAIDIYKDLNDNEKVGDLYVCLNKKDIAQPYYKIVADKYEGNDQFVKASLLYRKKMEMPREAQQLLLKGWHEKKDPENCLNNYFAALEDNKHIAAELKRFYNEELDPGRAESFLQVIKHEHKKDELLKETTRDIAFEIVAANIERNPFIASELIGFNKQDARMSKDVLKFKAQQLKK